MSSLNPYAKAIAGALLAGLGAYQVALLTPGVTAAEWAGIAIATLGTLTGVYVTTNKSAGE